MQMDGAGARVPGIPGVADHLSGRHTHAGAHPFAERFQVGVVVGVAVGAPQPDRPASQTDVQGVRPADHAVDDRDEGGIAGAEDIGTPMGMVAAGVPGRAEAIAEAVAAGHGEDPVETHLEDGGWHLRI